MINVKGHKLVIPDILRPGKVRLIWKKYILEFLNQFDKYEFTSKEVVDYVQKKYKLGKYKREPERDEIEQKVIKTLNDLTKVGSFRKSKDFDYELEKKGLYDIRLNKFRNHWNFNIETIEEHNKTREFIKKFEQRKTKDKVVARLTEDRPKKII